MKILFKQPDNGMENFEQFGIKQCYFKHLFTDRDSRLITRKEHHHNGFEIHIIEKGHQIYSAGGESFKVREGEFLLIPPFVSHRVEQSAPYTSKFSITFVGAGSCESVKACAVGRLDERINGNIARAVAESEKRLASSASLISCAVFESVVLILRACGMRESGWGSDDGDSDSRLLIAKQYINDNSEQWLKVSDVAAYCYLSEKQLTRIFAAEGVTPAAYIRAQRIKRIERLLDDKALPLKDISDKMNFSSEYYFNAFFKKYSGMTPGEYRKMCE